MPSFMTVLQRIANVWGTRRDDLAAQVGWGLLYSLFGVRGVAQRPCGARS